MKKLSVVGIFSIALLTSCVSKKKYVQLEQDLIDTKGELQQTTLEKEELIKQGANGVIKPDSCGNSLSAPIGLSEFLTLPAPVIYVPLSIKSWVTRFQPGT